MHSEAPMAAHHDMLTNGVTHTISFGGAIAILGTIVGILPPIAAALAIVWYVFQIYESKTFKSILKWFKSLFK